MTKKQTKKQTKKPTQDEILDRRAQAAWEYRQRNRQAVNERAKIRMRESVDLQLHASSPLSLWS
jgi:hypothetical protein